jgi:hypothetical protein
MHHLGIPFSITPVEKVEYIFLEFFAIFINALACLYNVSCKFGKKSGWLTLSAEGKSTSLATVFNRLKMIATLRLPSLPSFFKASKREVSSREN